MGRPLQIAWFHIKTLYPIGLVHIAGNIFYRIAEFLLAYAPACWKYMYSLKGQRSNSTVDHQRIGICLGQSVKTIAQSCPESIRAFVNVFASFILGSSPETGRYGASIPVVPEACWEFHSAGIILFGAYSRTGDMSCCYMGKRE